MSSKSTFLPDETLFESFTFPFFQFDFNCDHGQLHRSFMSVPDAHDAQGRRGLYVHIPFCDTICTFCPFLKSVGSAERIANYLVALEREIDAVSVMARVRSWVFDSIYIGGGTPSVLTPDQASHLISLLKRKFAILDGAELTFEVEAKSASAELLHAVAEAGATRISFGIQTLDPSLRKIVNLTASHEEIERTIEIGSKLFNDVNADMIVGFPGQSTDDALLDLHRAVGLGASSISLYPMDYSTVMSKLLDRMRTGSLPKPEDVAARWDMFHRGRELLSGSYNEQNMYCFGVDGVAPCNYMFDTLYGGYHDSYLGLGCGAYTALPGMISHNIASEAGYVKACLEGNGAVQRVSPGHAYEKSLVFFPKRLKASLLEARDLGLHAFYEGRIQHLVDIGAVESDGFEVALTDIGKRMYHRIMVGFLGDMNKRIYDLRCVQITSDLGLGPDGSLLHSKSKARGMPAAWHLGVDKDRESADA